MSGNIEFACAVPRTPVLILDLLMGRDAPLTSNAICRAGALMDIPEITMRVALTRLVVQGKVQRSQRGLYSLAHHDARALHTTVNQWQHKHALAIAWRQRDWIAVHDGALAKSDRVTRRHHVLSLALFGFRELRPGLHVRPNNLKGGVHMQSKRLRALGLAPAAIVFKASHLSPEDEREATRLWDTASLVAADERCIAALERSMQAMQNMPLDRAVKESLLLGREVIAHLVRDPVLPAELMPRYSRDRLLALASTYQTRARTLWDSWFATANKNASSPEQGGAAD